MNNNKFWLNKEVNKKVPMEKTLLLNIEIQVQYKKLFQGLSNAFQT